MDAAVDHVAGDGPAQEEGAVQVHREDVQPFGGIHIDHRRVGKDSGAIDQHVDVTRRFDGLGGQLVDRRLIADIGRKSRRGAARVSH